METGIPDYGAVFQALLNGAGRFDWDGGVMLAVACLFVAAVARRSGLTYAIPVGFGAVLANIPFSAAASRLPGAEGFLTALFNFGISYEIFPVLLLFTVGTRCDFSPVIRRPVLLLVALASQSAVLAAVLGGVYLGLPLGRAAAVGLACTLDGPTAVYVANRVAAGYTGLTAILTCGLAAVWPAIGAAMARLMSGPGEIGSDSCAFRRPISWRARLLFPVAVTLLAAAAAPPAASLVGSLMAGNLLREASHGTRLAVFWQGPGAAIAAVLFGLAAGGALDGQRVALADLATAAVVGLPTLVLTAAFGIFATKIINALLKNRLPLLAGTHSLAVFPCSRRDFRDVYGAGQIVSVLLGSIVVNFLLL